MHKHVQDEVASPVHPESNLWTITVRLKGWKLTLDQNGVYWVRL